MCGAGLQLFVKVLFTCLPYGPVFRSRRSLSCRIIHQANGLLETVLIHHLGFVSGTLRTVAAEEFLV